MSQLAAFIEVLQQSPTAMQDLKGITNPDALTKRLVAQAQALGYDVSAEEVQSFLTLSQPEAELGDQELAQVTGGGQTYFDCTGIPNVCL